MSFIQDLKAKTGLLQKLILYQKIHKSLFLVKFIFVIHKQKD